MIRPFTCVCALLAGASGLYLYSEKHRTTLLDQQISKIVSDTEHTRERTAMLRAEWALLNQPDRLQGLATRFLPQLQAMAPTQFVQLASLEKRLPPPGPETPARPIVTPQTAPGLVGQSPAVIPPTAIPNDGAPDGRDQAPASEGVAIARVEPRATDAHQATHRSASVLLARDEAPPDAASHKPVQIASTGDDGAGDATDATTAPQPVARRVPVHVALHDAGRHGVARTMAPIRLADGGHEATQRFRPAVTSASSYARPQVIAAASWRPAHASWAATQPATYTAPSIGSSLGSGHASLAAPVPLSDGN